MAHPVAFMHTPSLALGACVLAGVERDTRGCLLNDAERFNYYPATPMAVISWIFDGALHMVEERGPTPRPTFGPALPRLVFSGPQRYPSVSWSPGAVHALSVGFYPEALSRLIRRPIEPYLDQTLPLEAVAPPALLRASQAILDAGDDEPFATLEAQFLPLWREPGRASPAPYLGDWVRSVATRAAHTTAGLSLRQWQRRIRDWTGQSHRDLQLFARVENAFLRRIVAGDGSTLDLAAIAADAGFADQSHMGREIRRVTGWSPALFGQRLGNDEAFWYYRLLAGELGGRG
jgi:AraC-like DNA-binding protein